MANPLQKYYRQPKIFLSLPSKGKYYPPGMIEGDPDSLPVFGMAAMDEIILKTPDALFSGESIVSLIRSCIPSIKNPWLMPQLDVDACLIAIRMATYGEKLETSFKCTSCEETNNFDLDLTGLLEYFNTLSFEDSVITGPLLVNLRPLTYKELTEINLKGYEYRRQLITSFDNSVSEDDKNKILDQAYKNLASLTIESFKKTIVSVEVEDEVVTDQKDILEWLNNSDKEFFDAIKQHVENQKDTWSIQNQKVECAHCNAENNVSVNLDNSNFFVRS